MRILRSPLAALLLGLGLVFSAGCSTTQRVKAETAIAKALISDEQETQLGLQVRDELQKQNVKYLEDPQVEQYVSGIAAKLFRVAEKDRPGVKWQVKVIDDPKTVNAFATPGGFLYVYSGLLLTAANEAEVAGVLAHETGHVVGRHSARQMVNAYGLEAVSALALGENPSLLKQLGATVAGKGLMLAHSRSEEQEADEYGARYTAAVGYDPHGLVTFFEKLAAQEGGGSSKVLTWLSSHPATPDRIAHINQYIQQHQLSGKDLGADRLAPIKARIPGRG